MKQIAKILTAVAPLFCAAALFADGLGGLRNLTTTNSILPLFNEGKLQMLLYGREVVHFGGLLKVTKPILDIIRQGVPVDAVKSDFTEGYPLYSDLATVYRFWAPRVVFSEAVILSGKADVDQKIQQAHGEEMIYFRSPSMDVDGLGFQADYGKKKILVKKDVKIVIRSGASDIKNAVAAGKAPTVAEGLNATSDSMFVDLDKGEVTLIDNVVVDQADNTIYCDRMVIYLARDGKGESDTGLIDSGVGGSGQVSRIVCTGHVRLDTKKKKKDAKQKSAFDLFGRLRAVHGDLLYCAGEKKTEQPGKKPAPPTISSDGSDLDLKHNILTFTGNVEVRDPKLDVDCDVMKIYLEDRDAAGKIAAPGKGRKIVKKIVCTGKVKATEARLFLSGDNATLFFHPAGKKPTRASGMFNSGSTELEKIHVLGNLKLVTRPENDPKRDKTKPLDPPSVLTSEEGTMFLEENRAEFLRDVHVTDPKFNLDSERLDVYAIEAEKAQAERTAKTKAAAASKDPDEPIDPDAEFNGVPGSSGAPGSGVKLSEGLELDRILARKNVVISQKDENGKDRRASGEKADYPVREEKIYLSGTPEKPPRLENATGKFSGGMIEVDLARDTMVTRERGTFTLNPAQ